jgi:hypothetical protein
VRPRTARRARALIVVVLCGTLPAAADGAQSARLEVALSPERLGHGTTLEFGFRIAAPAGVVPSPLTGLDLSYPQHFGIATSGLGVATCSPAVLEQVGSDGCPADSRMGYGSAIAEIQEGPEILQETAATSIFMAPVQNGSLALLFFADGEAPLSAQIVFPALLLPAQAPFGGNLAIAVPLVPSVPAAPYVAVVRLRATIGPRRLTYYEHAHGQLVAYRPKGIVLPARCPHGGFPFAATFKFADASSAIARAVVPCPGHQGPHGPGTG